VFDIGIPGYIFLSLAATCAILSGLVIVLEIGEINRKLPDSEQIRYLGLHPGKMAHIKSEYKRLYPNGSYESWRIVIQVAAMMLAVLAAISIFLHQRGAA
jgi:hypothetical protein